MGRLGLGRLGGGGWAGLWLGLLEPVTGAELDGLEGVFKFKVNEDTHLLCISVLRAQSLGGFRFFWGGFSEPRARQPFRS